MQNIEIINDNNYHEVTIGKLTLYFSYKTVIAFDSPIVGKVVSENCWSTTTGKHLSRIPHDNNKRVSRDIFEKKLKDVLFYHKLTE